MDQIPEASCVHSFDKYSKLKVVEESKTSLLCICMYVHTHIHTHARIYIHIKQLHRTVYSYARAHTHIYMYMYQEIIVDIEGNEYRQRIIMHRKRIWRELQNADKYFFSRSWHARTYAIPSNYTQVNKGERY